MLKCTEVKTLAMPISKMTNVKKPKVLNTVGYDTIVFVMCMPGRGKRWGWE